MFDLDGYLNDLISCCRASFGDRLTVYFDEPFWVGVFERIEDGKLSVSKITFGAEPKDYEVWEFVLKHYYHHGMWITNATAIWTNGVSTTGASNTGPGHRSLKNT